MRKAKKRPIEFKVNKYITLRLEKCKTIIYIKGEKYIDSNLFCGVLLNVLRKRKESHFTVGRWHDLNSNKESVDFIIDSRQYKTTSDGSSVSYEEEFWAYCSNLQVWAENDYNTDLLHYLVSFPLLSKLIEVGDPLAKNVFKKEILRRIKNGTEETFRFLKNDEYLQELQSSDGPFFYSIIYERGKSVKLTNEEIIKGTLNSDEMEALMAIKKRTDLEYVIGISFGDDMIRKSHVCRELFFTIYNGQIIELEIELTKEHPNIPAELKSFKNLSSLHIWVNDDDIIIPQPPFKINSVGYVEIITSESVIFPKNIKSIFPNLQRHRIYIDKY